MPTHPRPPALIQALEVLPQRLLIGVSGGLDSMSLLHALHTSGRECEVAHFNHGWRKESSGDAEHVRQSCAKLGVPFHLGSCPPATPRTESAAREARYTFFRQLAHSLALPDLVLAHHANDQVETFLLQLLRGGASGACGMESSTERDGMILHRPWLGVWRLEIAAYARQNEIVWREDATNNQTDANRNWLRNEALPLLRQRFGDGLDERLWRTTQVLGAQATWIAQLVQPFVAEQRLSVAHLRDMPIAQQRAVLMAWLRKQGVGDLGFERIEAALALLTKERPARVNLPRNQWLRRRAGWLEVVPVPHET